MTETPASTNKIDWTKLDLSVRDEVNGHIEARYIEGAGWQSPRVVRDPYLQIHGLSPSINYGQQAHEGMKAYRSPNGQILLFRVDKHASRLTKSAQFISIPPLPTELFRRCVNLAVWLNAEFVPPAGSGAALYIRPVVIGLSASLIPSPPKEYLFFIYVQPLAPYLGTDALSALLLEEYDRTAPKGTGGVKIGGNYAPVIRWGVKAKSEGYGILLHLDSKTRTSVDEFSTAAFIGILENGDQITMVISDSDSIISSVTADSAAHIAKDIGWVVERRTIKYDELASFSEVMAAGTAAGLVPIRSITQKSQDTKVIYSAADKSGKSPRCSQLTQILSGIMQGNVEDKYGWCELVIPMNTETRAMLA